MLLITVAVAQGASSSHHDQIGYVPREIMSRPVPLRSGIGSFHYAITTSSPQAQRFYDQGQSYLHSYVWIEAARSFHQALRLDPKLVMAYVGLSYAYSPIDYQEAKAMLDRAAALSTEMSEREKRRIEIRRLQLEAMPEPQNFEKLSAFRRSIEAALAAAPSDTELLLLRGQAEEPGPFGDGQGCTPSAIPFYKKVLEFSPDNFAANHYLAHCYENIGSINDALEFAQAYVRQAPSVAHAHHMLGHELRRAGRVEEAIVEFRKADNIEREYARTENIPSFMDWHHAHNLGLMADCYQSLGEMTAAESVLRKEIALPIFTDYAMLGRSNWPTFLLIQGRFAEAREAAMQMQRLPSPLAQVAGHALAGQAELRLNPHNRASAERELAAANGVAERLSAQDAAAVRPFLLALGIEIQLSAGDHQGALAEFQELIQRVKATSNPDAWGQGLFRLELLASFARRNGDWETADETAQAMLDHDAQYAGSHFAAAMVSQHNRDSLSAQREFADAAKLWSSADRNLASFAYARSQLTIRPQMPGSQLLK